MRAKKLQNRLTGGNNSSLASGSTTVKKSSNSKQQITKKLAATDVKKLKSNANESNKNVAKKSKTKSKLSSESTTENVTKTSSKPKSTVNSKSKSTLGSKDDKKIVKPNKELKNLDIQITETESSNTAIASISEVVKTKSRSTVSAHSNLTPANSPTPQKATAEMTVDSVNEKEKTKSKTTPLSASTKSGDDIKKNKNVSKVTKNVEKGVTKSTDKTGAPNKKKKNETKLIDKKKIVDEKMKSLKKPKPNKVNKAKAPPESVEKSATATNDTTPEAVEDANKSMKSAGDSSLAISKSIEIKTDESKSLIDTITDAINEVVQQYKDSARGDQTTNATVDTKDHEKSDTKVKAKKAKAATPSSGSGKVVKISKKKSIKEAMNATKNAGNLTKVTENVAKKPTTPKVAATKKLPKEKEKEKIDEKSSETKSAVSNSQVKPPTTLVDATQEKSSTNNEKKTSPVSTANQASTEMNVTSDAVDDSSMANKTKTQIAILKKTKKLIAFECGADEVKGSKMIKIDSKTKKIVSKTKMTKSRKESSNDTSPARAKGKINVRSIETLQSPEAIIRNANNSTSSAATKKSLTTNKIAEDIVKDDADATASTLETEPNDDEKNAKKPMSKQQRVTKSKNKKATTVKSTLIASTLKRKTNKSTAKKTTMKSTQPINDKESAVEIASSIPNEQTTVAKTDDGKVAKDVYDFQESGHSSEDASSAIFKKNNKKASNSIPSTPTKKMLASAAAKERTLTGKSDVTSDSDAITAADTKCTAKKKTEKSEVVDNNRKETETAKKKLPPKKAIKAKALASDAESKQQKDDTYNDADDGYDRKPKNTNTKRKMTEAKNDKNSDDDSSDDSTDDSDASVQTRFEKRNRSKETNTSSAGPKRHRMASLNALAKVQCLYENESRTAQELGFVKEPRIAPKEMRLLADTAASAWTDSTSSTVKKSKEKNVSHTKDDEKTDDGNNRTLRHGPGRGAGTMWEMDDSSLDESEIDEPNKQVTDDRRLSSGGNNSIALNSFDLQKCGDKPKATTSSSTVTKTKKTPTKRVQSTTKKLSQTKGDACKATTTKKSKSLAAEKFKSSHSDNSDEDSSDAEPPDRGDSGKMSMKKMKKSTMARKTSTVTSANASPSTSSDFKEILVRSQRMASLNASAMMAATYEVERHLDHVDSMYDSIAKSSSSAAESETQTLTPKKMKDIKDIKDEVLDAKEVRLSINFCIALTLDLCRFSSILLF